MTSQSAPTTPGPRARSAWTRLAQFGFWFFLIKGLLWLLVPVGAVWLGLHSG